MAIYNIYTVSIVPIILMAIIIYKKWNWLKLRPITAILLSVLVLVIFAIIILGIYFYWTKGYETTKEIFISVVTYLKLRGLLIITTYLLVVSTAHNVEENRIDRKIAFKEKRLEKLYTPIINHKEWFISPYAFSLANPILRMEDLFMDLIKYTHLAHDEIKDRLEYHLKNILHGIQTQRWSRDEIKKYGQQLYQDISEKAWEDRESLKELRP